jgi:hypothetical protein
MKIYKDNEFIKVAKYRQCANEFLTKMEAEGNVKLEQVVVDDSVATFQYGGVREGQPISFSIPVKRNSGASGITCTYGGTTRSFDFMQYFNYEDFWIWLKSIAKLDTEEAKDGTLPMLVDEWLSIPEHKEFYELARKAFLRYVYFKDHLATNSRCFINMPQTKYMAVARMKSHPVLVYDSNLHDFVKARDNNEICVCVGITSRHTVYVMYSTSDYRERTNEMYPRMFPEFTHVKKGCLSDEHYIETDLDNAVSIVKSVRDRLLAFYDDIAKSHGMPDSWKKAKDWTFTNPVYDVGTPDYDRIMEKLNASKEAIIDKHISTIKNMYEKNYRKKIEDYFPDATFLRQTEEWCIENPTQRDYVAFLQVPFKYPRIKGTKIAWQDKPITVRIEYQSYNSRFTSSYTVPFKFVVMDGEYDWFAEAKKHDDEKMMIIKPCRRKYSDIGSCVFQHLREHLNEIDQFIKYKGLKNEG